MENALASIQNEGAFGESPAEYARAFARWKTTISRHGGFLESDGWILRERHRIRASSGDHRPGPLRHGLPAAIGLVSGERLAEVPVADDQPAGHALSEPGISEALVSGDGQPASPDAGRHNRIFAENSCGRISKHIILVFAQPGRRAVQCQPGARKVIGLRTPGTPSGAICSPRATTWGSAKTCAMSLIGPAGTPCNSQAASSSAIRQRFVAAVIRDVIASRLVTRSALVRNSGASACPPGPECRTACGTARRCRSPE